MAPIPNMEISSAIPAKRGPEEEVQFVSAHPVKKCRGSRDSPLVQGQQVSEQSVTQQPTGPTTEAQSPTDPFRDAGVAPSTSEPQPVLARGVSMPGMENYVFPPPLNGLPSQTSRSSPMVSPKQLPAPMLPSHQTHAPSPAVHGLPNMPTGFLPPTPHRGLQIPWGMSGLYPQPAPATSSMTWTPRIQLPPFQSQRMEPPLENQNQEPSPRRSPVPEKQVSVAHPPSAPCPESQRQTQGKETPQADMSHAQTTTEPEQAPQPLASQAPPVQPVPSPPPRSETEAQRQFAPHVSTPTHTPAPAQTQAHALASNSNTSAAPQSQAPKPPCLICEQMRQQAFFSQANGHPVAHSSHLQQHGWHGLGPYQQQLHLAHPPPMGPGMGMQNFQFRFQPLPPGQVPMGYALPHVPLPVSMSMQRAAPVANMSPGEQPQAGLPQSNQNPNQQASPDQASRVLHGMPQFSHAVYMQNQMLPPQQATVAPRQFMTATQAPVPAPPPSSPAVTQAPPPSQSPPAPQDQAQPEPRKPSPNLIVDIADTCEGIFPWDEVAKRHGVPRVKVVETFAAIIQLPLLRCTTDKKKHGKLATSRLREYTKAKKDVEAANTSSSAAKTPTATPAPQANPFRPPQSHHASQPQASQAGATQNRSLLPGVLEMASTMAPLGLPSTLTNGLTGPWGRQ